MSLMTMTMGTCCRCSYRSEGLSQTASCRSPRFRERFIADIFQDFTRFGICGLTCDKVCWHKKQLHLLIEGPLAARERLCALRVPLPISVLLDKVCPGQVLYLNIVVANDDDAVKTSTSSQVACVNVHRIT